MSTKIKTAVRSYMAFYAVRFFEWLEVMLRVCGYPECISELFVKKDLTVPGCCYFFSRNTHIGLTQKDLCGIIESS
jgi:hypothetical protein